MDRPIDLQLASCSLFELKDDAERTGLFLEGEGLFLDDAAPLFSASKARGTPASGFLLTHTEFLPHPHTEYMCICMCIYIIRIFNLTPICIYIHI